MFPFTIEKKLKNRLGRAGSVTTPHGVIETPAFVVVGTKATVKGVTPEQLHDLGAQVILANTYHLYLQPGDARVREAGGLHTFMHWDGPTMTDSGGFQAYSLGTAYAKNYNKFLSRSELEKITQGETVLRGTKEQLMRISEEGAAFRSHLDGSKHLLSPEKSIAIQHNIGADIIFAFDECTAPMDPYDYQKESMERTHRWAKRSLAAHRKGSITERVPPREQTVSEVQPHSKEISQALFGIVQGGPYQDLREVSARVVGGMDFEGFGIGGSYTKEDMEDTIQWVNPLLPEEKPRHLLGIGDPLQLFIGIEHGVDTFDCVSPTREARNGALYTCHGRVNIFNAKFVNDFSKIDEECGCYTCTNYTRAYLAHLFRAKELLAFTLASIHNLYFIVHLVKKIRQAILDDRFFEVKEEFLRAYYH